MAVSSSALTLAQYALLSNNPLVQRVTYSLLQNSNILEELPLVPRKSMLANGVRWVGNLPSINWSKLNVDPVVTSGTPQSYQEQAFIVRNAIDVDRFLVEDENQIVDPRGAQADAFLTSLAYEINDRFINNDHLSGNADAPVGLRYRLDNQTTYGVNSDMKIDAGGVDLSAGGMTAATANTFVEYVQQVLDYMGSPSGEGVVLYMNDYLKRKFEKAVRIMGAGAGFSIVKDAFDRPIEMYKMARVKDIGRKADQTTRIITNTEASTGVNGTSNYTSLYAVRYGTDYTFGWEFEELQPKDIGLIGNGGSTYRLLIDWAFGIFMTHTRGIARLYDIKTS